MDLISFDAYTNPNNLSIIPEKVNDFLVGGGRINWAIVPVVNENCIREMTLDFVEERFLKTITELINTGVSERLVYKRAMVSMQGNIDKYPLIFAEKALIITSQLSKRIPLKK